MSDEAAFQLQQLKSNMSTKATKVSHYCMQSVMGPIPQWSFLCVYLQLKQMTSGFFSDLQTRYS